MGVERSFIQKPAFVTDVMPHMREVREIVRLKQVVGQYTQEFFPGQYSYGFYLYLPDWLPDSVHFKTAEGDHLFVEYTIRASFITDDPMDQVVDRRFKDS